MQPLIRAQIGLILKHLSLEKRTVIRGPVNVLWTDDDGKVWDIRLKGEEIDRGIERLTFYYRSVEMVIEYYVTHPEDFWGSRDLDRDGIFPQYGWVLALNSAVSAL